ncbi:MAG: hypothetical protein LBV67_07090 [Streptococcaceae bacterium]|jgi:hypothetical protein|nr:hypothetical protein [Streptococcaceae bacterium]
MTKEINETLIGFGEYACTKIYLENSVGVLIPLPNPADFKHDEETIKLGHDKFDGELTLNQIYKRYMPDNEHLGMLYVFTDHGLRGAIYRAGNYTPRSDWQKYAVTEGYA